MSFVVKEQPGFTQIQISQKFELIQVTSFREWLHQASHQIADGEKILPLFVDFTNLEYLDSSGIGVLLSLKTLCEKNGIAFAFYNISPKILQLFKLTDIDTMFPVFTNRQEAEQYLLNSQPVENKTQSYKAFRYPSQK